MVGPVSRLRLGTRGSRLALVQSRAVAAALEAHGADVELVEIRTTGDRIKDVALGPSIGQSFFTKELEDALLDGRADLAVHSCKDLATRLPDGLVIGAVLEREDPRDVLVSALGALADLPPGATVGTASVRRRRFLELARPDLEVRDLRGNVPRRVAAVDEGRFDAVVLAAAGLHRLGLGDRITEYLPTGLILPAAAQGAVAVQIRADDHATRARVARLDHPETRACVTVERTCLRALEAGCQAPVGALATMGGGGGLTLDAAVVLDGRVVRTRVSGPPTDADRLGEEAASALLSALGLDSLAHTPWAGPPPRRLEPEGTGDTGPTGDTAS